MDLKRLLGLVAIAACGFGLGRAQDSTPPGPTFTGSPANCNKWYLVKSGDNCDTVAGKFGISRAQFLAWNPAVSSDCATNFWLGEAYCVGVGESVPSSTTKPSSSQSETVTRVTTPPGPTFTGSPDNCNSWYLIESGNNCGSVEAKFGITHDQCIAWNPAVSKDCTSNFWLGQAYCVGLGPPVTKPTTTTTSSSDSSSSAPSTTTQAPTTTTPYSTRYPVTNQTLSRPTYSTDWPPQKTQPGQPSYCNNWHLVQAGQTCANIIAQYGTWMSADDL